MARREAFKIRLRDGPASYYRDKATPRNHIDKLKQLILPGLVGGVGGRNIFVHGGRADERTVLVQKALTTLQGQAFNDFRIDMRQLTSANDLFVRIFEKFTG